MDASTRQTGFTLLETTIAIAVSIPILGAVFLTNNLLRGEVRTADAAASLAETVRTTGHRLELLARAGALSTCQVRANPDDVAAALAAQATDPAVHVPTIGEWISPNLGTQHDTFRFRAASGELSLNASSLTPYRELEFALDNGEVANGIDDDGDGLVDEGSLRLTINGAPANFVDGVEHCAFALSDRVLQMTLTCARRDAAGQVLRVVNTYSVCMRNN